MSELNFFYSIINNATMERKLKFHERKLLKKVDFLDWKNEQNVREGEVIRRYHIQNRDDYTK